jgi:putative glutamine amidotransferase
MMSSGRRFYAGLLVSLAACAAAVALFAGAYYVPDPGGSSPRVLVSIDRTLWNRVGLNRLTYVRKLRLAGLSPVLVEYSRQGEMPAGLFEGVDGLVLTGGGDVAASTYNGDPSVSRNVIPARDTFEFALIERAETTGLPILGLCRGAQLINVQRGGTLGDFRDEARFSVHRNALSGHPVSLESDSRLREIYGSDRLEAVTTWHGQHVDQPGQGLVIGAYSEDSIPEAIEARGDPFLIGVQWHAEMPPWDVEQDRLFEAFADAVRTRRYSPQAATKPSNRRR